MKRCFGNKEGQELYAKYHDEEWGVPVHDDQKLFEFIILEGAQAGLSWYTILKRREGYREAFKGFDPELVAKMTDEELEDLRSNEKIIRNKLKIYAARTNAIVFLAIQKEFGSFDTYLWAYMDNKPLVNNFSSMADVPVTTDISDKIAKDLKKRGMKFVGSTIIYAYMQAIGMVDDHGADCWKRQI
ncbi:DNA-3-methyladenine glycosylase I [Vallitalea sediminicola]